MNKYYNKKKYAFIVYRYEEFKNDYEYIKEYYKTADIEKDYKIMNCRQYIVKNIEEVKHLINNKYVIVKELIENEI